MLYHFCVCLYELLRWCTSTNSSWHMQKLNLLKWMISLCVRDHCWGVQCSYSPRGFPGPRMRCYLRSQHLCTAGMFLPEVHHAQTHCWSGCSRINGPRCSSGCSRINGSRVIVEAVIIWLLGVQSVMREWSHWSLHQIQMSFLPSLSFSTSLSLPTSLSLSFSIPPFLSCNFAHNIFMWAKLTYVSNYISLIYHQTKDINAGFWMCVDVGPFEVIKE